MKGLSLIFTIIYLFVYFIYLFLQKTLQAEVIKILSTKQQPYLLLRLKCLDGTYTKPLSPEKMLGLTLRSSENRELVLDSMTKLSAAVSLIA